MPPSHFSGLVGSKRSPQVLPCSEAGKDAEKVSYLEEGSSFASPYRVTKSDLAEKGDDSETLYSYAEYGKMGHYQDVGEASWKDRLIPHKVEKHESDTAPTTGNETQRIGMWLASQYYFQQAVYLIAVGLMVWIPGIIALAFAGPNAKFRYNLMPIFGVGAFWWSVWLFSAWIGLWLCYCVATMIPRVSKRWVGVFSIALRRYIAYAEATRCYITLALWAILAWILYLSIVLAHFPGYSSIDTTQIDPLTMSNASISSSNIPSPAPILIRRGASDSISAASLESNASWLTAIGRLLLGLIICSAILLVEKILMQSIALSFHQTTYQDRIKQSNEHITILTGLLSYMVQSSSTNGVDHLITLAVNTAETKKETDTSSITSRARQFRLAEASRKGEARMIPCDKVLLTMPGSPFSLSAYVETALEDEIMSKEMANQLFNAFAHSANPTLPLEMKEVDIRKCYETDLQAHQAFVYIDRDSNASCNWDEFEASVLEMHRERLCLLASLHDVDSAVLKLDNFFMSFYLFLSCVIIAALLSSKFSTLVASLGTIMLGLSWLVGSAAQEPLNSIIWVFGKHPIDVGDAVEIPGLLSSSTSNMTPENVFTAEEIQLLSTVLKTTTGKLVLVSNFQLAQRTIINIRRSGPMEELFIIDVEFSTALEKIEVLREKMMEWISSQGRDFLPGLSIQMSPLQDQSAISLKMDIRYKSNWQDGHLKVKRRNDWMTALRGFMEGLQIKGPPIVADGR